MVDYSIWLERDTWAALWSQVKKTARQVDAAITMVGERLVAKLNEIPGMSAFSQTVFNLPEIPQKAGKWVGYGATVAGGYGGYRAVQWLSDARLENKVAATESDLLPFLDLLKLQDLRRGDYRDVLHFCIDHRFFVTQFPASPPHKFKKAVPALYELIQAYGQDGAKQGTAVEAFLASDAVQSLFFESEGDYKLIEIEFYDFTTKQMDDHQANSIYDLFQCLDHQNKIVHVFDSKIPKSIFLPVDSRIQKKTIEDTLSDLDFFVENKIRNVWWLVEKEIRNGLKREQAIMFVMSRILDFLSHDDQKNTVHIVGRKSEFYEKYIQNYQKETGRTFGIAEFYIGGVAGFFITVSGQRFRKTKYEKWIEGYEFNDDRLIQNLKDLPLPNFITLAQRKSLFEYRSREFQGLCAERKFEIKLCEKWDLFPQNKKNHWVKFYISKNTCPSCSDHTIPQIRRLFDLLEHAYGKIRFFIAHVPNTNIRSTIQWKIAPANAIDDPEFITESDLNDICKII